jgi:ABC-2 type transport system ATP-binding protein
MKYAVEIKDLSKQFGNLTALKDVNITVKPGEVFGFLGPNGAGKTTAIRAMLNLIKPTEGTITILGMDAQKEYKELHKHIGYLAGDMSMYDNLRAEQYINYMANLHGNVETGQIAILAGKLQANLKPRIKTLSRGNKQKIGLIAAMMHKPQLLIMDEPTTGLDPLMQEVFYELLAEHTKAGGTTFMSSHNLSEVQRVCDRVAFIRNGELVEVSKVSTLRSSSVQEFEVHFAKEVPEDIFKGIRSVNDVQVDGDKLTCVVKGHLNEFLAVLGKYDVLSVANRELELDEVFMKLYGEVKS